MAKADLVAAMHENDEKEGKGFVKVYTPSKKKDKGAVEPAGDWEQTVNLRFKDFPGMKDHKIGEHMVVTVKGPVSRMDKEGVSVALHFVRVGEE